MSEEPREKRLADYTELLEGLLEMVAMQEEAGGDDDEELSKLIVDAEEQLRSLATSLNEEETIAVTPGLVKVVLPSQDTPVILFPPPGQQQPLLCAPYEVQYDGREWHACVITAVLAPPELTDRRRYRAWILGYNIEETVVAEALRPWAFAQEEQRKNAARSGAACNAINPSTARFEAATVERLTLEGTVMVTFANKAEVGADSGVDGEPPAPAAPVELPLSHVYGGAKFYPALRKRPQLTEEQRQQQRRENARRKRERAEEEKQLQADKVAQDKNDWQALMGDMMGGGENKKKRRF